jgi:pyruvate formate lyase activating enzyme
VETLIYKKLADNKVQCGICSHFCTIKDGRKGICMVRENHNGRLISTVYPKVISTSIDPIEKKPIFHLKPGSKSYSFASVGCNFKCSFCQNASIAQMPSDNNGMIQGIDTRPEDIVKAAVESECESIAYTYTEPTIFFEIAYETAKIAKKAGLFNIFVTNGFMSRKALEMIAPYLDAANVDLKAFDDSFYRKYCKAMLEPVKDTIRTMKKMGILIELTTLLIPGLNDKEGDLVDMSRFIANDIGTQTPWHISRFHPTYKMMDLPPTPVSILQKAYNIGKTAGLQYVYTGNIPGLASENTYCHKCNALLIERYGYQIKNFLKNKSACPDCGTHAYGIY